MKSIIVAAALVAGSIASAVAGSPVAIVEDIRGKVTGVELMDYVEAGKVIKLGADGTVILGYMTSCWRETIKGGVAIVGAEESRTSLGEVSREKVDCDRGSAQLSDREATQSAATAFRSISAEQLDSKPRQVVLYGLSPVIELARPGKLVIERIDVPGERVEARVSYEVLVKGRFYDLAAAGKSLMPGGTYAATRGSQRTVFKIDPHARPGASPIVGRLLRL